MKVTVYQKPRIVVDVFAEIEGSTFYVFDLREIIKSLDNGENIRVTDPVVATELVALGILSSPGRRDVPATRGPRFDEAKKAIAEAMDDTEIDLPLDG